MPLDVLCPGDPPVLNREADRTSACVPEKTRLLGPQQVDPVANRVDRSLAADRVQRARVPARARGPVRSRQARWRPARRRGSAPSRSPTYAALPSQRCVLRQIREDSAVDIHRPDHRLRGSAPRVKGDALSTRRPCGIPVTVAAARESPGVGAVGSHDVKLGAEPSVPPGGAVGYPPAVRRPGRTPDVARLLPAAERPVRRHAIQQPGAILHSNAPNRMSPFLFGAAAEPGKPASDRRSSPGKGPALSTLF